MSGYVFWEFNDWIRNYTDDHPDCTIEEAFQSWKKECADSRRKFKAREDAENEASRRFGPR